MIERTERIYGRPLIKVMPLLAQHHVITQKHRLAPGKGH